MNEIPITRAAADDAAGILSLLERSELPTAGLLEHLEHTFVAKKGSEIVGSAALERYKDGALLRSVAVDASARGSGLGTRLTVCVLDSARELDAPAIYLLTMTAEGFFPRFGFEPIERSEVPESVQQSIEFTSACPASAIVMRKRL